MTVPPPKPDPNQGEFAEPVDPTQEATAIASEELLPLLQPKVNYFRKVNGFAPGITSRVQIQGIDPNLLDPNSPENVVFNKFVYSQAPGTTKKGFYKGDGLVNENNELVRGKYGEEDSELIDAANETLINLNVAPTDRINLLKELKRVGFYGKDEISTITLSGAGFTADDTQAMARYLLYSQQQFKTWEAAFPTLASLPSTSVDSGRRFTPYSEADMTRYLREMSLALTGELPSKAKLKKMLQDSVAIQRQAFATSTDTPSLNVIAESVVAEANPKQKAAYGLGNAISRAFATLGRG